MRPSLVWKGAQHPAATHWSKTIPTVRQGRLGYSSQRFHQIPILIISKLKLCSPFLNRVSYTASLEMAEAVGVALGVASLVFAAAESYHTATCFFDAMKHHPRKLKEALQVLRIQELCFRKANERLLSYCVDIDEARQMLRDPQHMAWRDEKIAREYVMLLGGDQRGFEAAINLICEKLDNVRGDFENLAAPPDAPVKAARQQLRFAFKASGVEKALGDLTAKTQNFVVLTNLVTPQAEARRVPGDKIASTTSRKDLRRCSAIKQTAEDLYTALESACTDHEEHKAFLNLNPVCSDTNQIQFTLAFSQLTLRAPDLSSDKRPAWLRVESSVTGRIESAGDANEAFGAIATRLKRTFARFDDEDNQSSTKMKRCVRFQDQQQGQLPTVSHKTPTNEKFQKAVVNLCQQGKICHHLANFMGLTIPNNQAVGYLERSLGSKHLIYLDHRFSTISRSSASPNLMSLRDLLRDANTSNSVECLGISHKTSLAKQLARAVLHFHTTAWLQDNWDSQSILVQKGNTSDTSDSSAMGPEAYATTRIHGPISNQALIPTTPNPLVVRNRLLFGLGIVLIELAYQKPLTALIDPLDQIDTAPQDVPYRAADRLSKRVSSILGANYAEAVRKCVHCDFGFGFDLKQARLQEAFYQSVVCELDSLAETLR